MFVVVVLVIAGLVLIAGGAIAYDGIIRRYRKSQAEDIAQSMELSKRRPR